MHELGLQPVPDHAARRMAKNGSRRTDEELLEHVRECATELGHVPGHDEYAIWQRQKLADAELVPVARARVQRLGGG